MFSSFLLTSATRVLASYFARSFKEWRKCWRSVKRCFQHAGIADAYDIVGKTTRENWMKKKFLQRAVGDEGV